MRMPAKNDEITAMAIAFLAGKGNTQADIAKTLRVSQAAVSRILRKSPHLEFQAAYRFREEGLSPETMDQVLKRALVKQLAPRLEAFAKQNGVPRAPVLRVLQIRDRDESAEIKDKGARFTDFTEQAAPHVRALLMRDAATTCGVTRGYMLSDLTLALRRLGTPRPWRASGPINFIPLTGDPLQDRKTFSPSLTSSNIAAELAKIANRDNERRPPWLGIVPAFIPFEDEADVQVVERLIHMAPDYEEIFGAAGRPGVADNLDVILTSVGPAENPLGFGLGRLLGSIGQKKLDALKQEIHGDIGGVLLPKNISRPSKLIRSIEHRWKGMEIKHLQMCAQRAFQDDPVSGRPGVVVLAMGRDRADVILHAVERGLVNHLLIDVELEQALHELFDSIAGHGTASDHGDLTRT
jgi:hypothetical protein